MSRRISYAGNREDVVLARALGLDEPGFYIDVGAAHPTNGSVTKIFYDAGWRGVNVEPLPHFAALLRRDRPRDTTLECALGTQPGEIDLHYSRSAYGATHDRESAAQHADGEPLTTVRVPVRTLADVWHEVGPEAPVDFLKVDVEGQERDVLAGADLAAMRPKVVVVEATAPYSSVQTHAEWEDQVLAAGYRLTLFDGVNRFYVRDDLPELESALSVPANVLDGYVPVQQAEAEDRAERAEFAARRAERALASVTGSRTWRWTSPVRSTVSRARRLTRR